MQSRTVVRAAVLAASVGTAFCFTATAWAQDVHEIPQSIEVQHTDDIFALTQLALRPAPVGPAAKAALDLLKRHHQRENEYILPPLTLLDALAAGKVTPDMRWAIPMADKVKATKELIFIEHTQITDAMNALLSAAELANDKEAVDFARSAVADSMGDMELQEPMTVLIGEYLKLKLPPAP
jgi:hypothetical protein